VTSCGLRSSQSSTGLQAIIGASALIRNALRSCCLGGGLRAKPSAACGGVAAGEVQGGSAFHGSHLPMDMYAHPLESLIGEEAPAKPRLPRFFDAGRVRRRASFLPRLRFHSAFLEAFPARRRGLQHQLTFWQGFRGCSFWERNSIESRLKTDGLCCTIAITGDATQETFQRGSLDVDAR
jgi:hypothetical protein